MLAFAAALAAHAAGVEMRGVGPPLPDTTGGMPNGAMLWVYRCDDNVTSWNELIAYLGSTAKSAGVTSVSLCAYR